MDSASWKRVRAVFEHLVGIPEQEREAKLLEILGDDSALCDEVRRMLRADTEEDAFLEAPGGATLASHGLSPHDSGPLTLIGKRLGPFVLEQRLASGGMGAVFEASQENPERKVAVKLIRPELLSDASRQRFHYEIEVLARLQHPAIAQIYEAGIHEEESGDSVPWFAMELVHGARPITTFASGEDLSTRARIELFLSFCEAIAHGHQRGVLHRDLKPGNLLVNSEGHAKVIDFGIARISDSKNDAAKDLTAKGEYIGTLLYMSPEQVAHGADGQDVRSDLYSMGLVLSEVLTGRHPFPAEGESITELLRSFEERRPERLAIGDPTFKKDLDWVIQKALASEKEQRYSSMQDFAADLRRLLAREPVEAGPPTRRYRFRSFVRKHRVAVLATSAVILSLLIGLTGATIGLVRATRAEKRTEKARKVAVQEQRVAVEERNRAVTAMDFLIEVFSRANPAKGARDVRMVEGLDLVAKIFEKRFEKQKDMRAMLARMLGLTYRGLGATKDADRYLVRALALKKELRGTEDPETARSESDLAVLRLEQGKLDEAEGLIHSALPILVTSTGGKSQDVLALRMHEGDLLRLRGKRKQAIEALKLVVQDMDAALPSDARLTLLAKNLLAGLLHESGKIDAAEPLYRVALAGLEARMGPDHPDTLATKFNLCALLFSRGSRKKAIELQRQVVASSIRVLGPAHRYTMRARLTLGAMLHIEKRRDEAAKCYYAALEASLSLSKTSPDVLILRSNIARLERERGNLDKAEPMLREVYAIREKTLGKDHAKTLISRSELAELVLARGQAKQGVQLLREGLALTLAKHAKDGPLAYRFHYALGRALAGQKRFAEAESELLNCEAIYQSADQKSSVRGRLQSPKQVLAALYRAWGKPAKAAKYRR